MSIGLFTREATGGAVARVGFEYQDAFVLEMLPKWLAESAFSHVVSEAIGDVEVCYFGTAGRIRRVMYEMKNHALTVTDFWKEVDHFKETHETSPEEFVRFALVCKSYNSNTNPLVAMVERIRGVGSSYQLDSVILEHDRRAVLRWAANNGYRADLAEFALDRVDFISYASEGADSAFVGELAKCLPTIDLGGKQARRLCDQCKGLIARSSSGPVCRKDLEEAICDVLGQHSNKWLSVPTKIGLRDDTAPFQELGLNVGDFNGPQRGSKSSGDWQALSFAATELGGVIRASTARRCVLLDGKQRMSTACMLGYAYGAARGFTLQIEHNGTEYRTDVHARADGKFFSETSLSGKPGTDEGVACIGFPTPAGLDAGAISGGTLAGLPTLVFDSARVIDGLSALNLAVAEVKTGLVRFASENRVSKLHLIIKAPSVFAMVLGHRLNGLCEIQLYDWVDGAYSPTALLFP